MTTVESHTILKPELPPEVTGLKAPTTLDEMQDYFTRLYGARNSLYLPGRILRIQFFNIAVGDLQDALRKPSTEIHKEVMYGRLVARVFCLADGMSDRTGLRKVSVANAMVDKYPEKGCLYCHQIICQCIEDRPDAVLNGWGVSEEQKGWSLRNWQQHLGMKYNVKNKEGGVDRVMARLFKEVTELQSFEADLPRSTRSTQENIREYGLEMADCLAWTIAAANLTEVDLEKAALERFWPNCWNCKNNPCICTHFNMKPVSGLANAPKRM